MEVAERVTQISSVPFKISPKTSRVTDHGTLVGHNGRRGDESFCNEKDLEVITTSAGLKLAGAYGHKTRERLPKTCQ